MRLSTVQTEILLNTTAKSKATAADLAVIVESLPGPTARAAVSLVDKGFLKAKTDKSGVTVYSRTGEGGKILKTLI